MIKIRKIKVQNFRLLKEFQLDLEDDLSLIIGKNNSGKTSLISIFSKFLSEKNNSKSFSCDDFNIDFQKHLKERTLARDLKNEIFLGISLKLFINYDENDDLSNLNKVLMDLDPDNKTVVLSFEYSLSKEDFIKFQSDFFQFETEQIEKIKSKIYPSLSEEESKNIETLKQNKIDSLFYDFFKTNLSSYFKFHQKSLQFDLETFSENDIDFIDLEKANVRIDQIINFKVISAKRDVSNKETDKTLSILSSKYYEKREGLQSDSKAIQQFKNTLTDTDEQLDLAYKALFKTVIERVQKFGGIKDGDSIIKIISTLQHRELLKGNTTVMYGQTDDHSLPEHYNGLGYMNLIGIIFEIEVLLTDFRKENRENEKPSTINILFIEEPEAHTHPQMQYVFMKNIKEILLNASKGDGGANRSFNLQTIITTHSSHITAECQFGDIKYFNKTSLNSVVSKNLNDLEHEYERDGEIQNYKFLKQYLTLNRAELFFADKAIFIEGDTERILVPAMMKKIDQDDPVNPLLSQNISIIEVGAYSQVFEKFIHFIGIKSLIITDIDSAKKLITNSDGKTTTQIEKCAVNDVDASLTTNNALIYFHGMKSDLSYFKTLSIDWKILRKRPRDNKWVSNKKGNLFVVYQIEELQGQSSYYPRSFEDAFFYLNKDLLKEQNAVFDSLTKKHLTKFISNEISVYEFVTKAIGSKPTLAMEILLNSKSDLDGNHFINWQTPSYIKQGLQWLKAN